MLLEVKNLSVDFAVGKQTLRAVNKVSFSLGEKDSLGLVGESGCGKSTTGRLINHLLIPDSGEIWFQGKEISHISQDEMRPIRKDMQMIFQDPAGSLNPRMRVSELIEEPLLNRKAEHTASVSMYVQLDRDDLGALKEISERVADAYVQSLPSTEKTSLKAFVAAAEKADWK